MQLGHRQLNLTLAAGSLRHVRMSYKPRLCYTAYRTSGAATFSKFPDTLRLQTRRPLFWSIIGRKKGINEFLKNVDFYENSQMIRYNSPSSCLLSSYFRCLLNTYISFIKTFTEYVTVALQLEVFNWCGMGGVGWGVRSKFRASHRLGWLMSQFSSLQAISERQSNRIRPRPLAADPSHLPIHKSFKHLTPYCARY
jgi:hypothetical protein